jgi:hypothetical protein
MAVQKYQRTTILLLLFLCVPSIWAASPLDGDWIGGFERPESHVYVHTHFRAVNNETTGTVDVIDMGDTFTAAMGEPLDKVELSPARVHFELADNAGPLSFEGRVTNGVMTDVVDGRGMKLPFRMDLMASIKPSRYAGIYQIDPGHFISIAQYAAPTVAWLIAFDIQAGQLNVLLPRSGTDFVCGSGVKAYPVQATIHFTTNQLGQVTALQWKPENAPAMVGPRIKPLPEDEVRACT